MFHMQNLSSTETVVLAMLDDFVLHFDNLLILEPRAIELVNDVRECFVQASGQGSRA